MLTCSPLVFSLLFCTGMIYCFTRILQLKKVYTIAAMQRERRGLLLDVDEKNADFFTTQLNLNESENLLKDEMCIYNVLIEDVDENATTVDETLERIVQKAKSFMQSNQLWNRDKFQCTLKDIFNQKGVFACVLGGKNTGESFVMQEMERLEQNVFVVNLRRNSNILGSLVEKLWERRLRFKLTDFDNAIIKILAGVVYKWTDGKVQDIVNQTDYQMVVDALIKKPAALSSVLEDISIGYGGVTLIVDEANIALTIKDSTTAAEIKATIEALAAFTRLTKETQKVSYIFTTSVNICLYLYMYS